eukprot:9411209-Lingulodinium_polyedra.AAC.1
MGERVGRLGPAAAAGVSLGLELVRVARDQGWIRPFNLDPPGQAARRALELCLPERLPCRCHE